MKLDLPITSEGIKSRKPIRKYGELIHFKKLFRKEFYILNKNRENSLKKFLYKYLIKDKQERNETFF